MSTLASDIVRAEYGSGADRGRKLQTNRFNQRNQRTQGLGRSLTARRPAMGRANLDWLVGEIAG
jgi:hypothetical protein